MYRGTAAGLSIILAAESGTGLLPGEWLLLIMKEMGMDRVSVLFLDALKASLESRIVDWDALKEAEAVVLMQLGSAHNVLPMLYESVYNCPAFRKLPKPILDRYRRNTLQQISLQTMKTVAFSQMYQQLRAEGIELCVVKGLICRSLYPDPDSRISSDEDVYVAPEHLQGAHEALIRYGMELDSAVENLSDTFELQYKMPGNPLFVEMHRHLFEPKEQAVQDMNRFFDGVHGRGARARGGSKEQRGVDGEHGLGAVVSGSSKVRRGVEMDEGYVPGVHAGECGLIEVEIDGVQYLTMNHTDNLLYLICHSFKHFLYSGFGLRQVCDINMYAMAYGAKIDWEYVLNCLRDLRADMFAASLFRIGEKYLTFDPAKACYPQCWKEIQVDEGLMLADLLDAGVYGQSLQRRRSSNITLDARAADRRGKKVRRSRIRSVLKSVFVPADQLKLRYKYLKKFPWLLPVAWVQRVLRYRKENVGKKGSGEVAESIRIGNERVELMREYGIIK